MRTPLVSMALAGLLLALPAQAQRPGQPPMQQPGMHGGMGGMVGMMGMMGMMSDPMMILRLREPLELTEQQVQRIEAVHTRVQPQVHQSMQQSMQLHQQGMEALMGATPDPDRHDALLRQAAERMLEAHSRMARAMVEAQQVLTPEQRDDLRFAMRAMRSMMREAPGGMGAGPMHHPPGMPPARR